MQLQVIRRKINKKRKKKRKKAKTVKMVYEKIIIVGRDG